MLASVCQFRDFVMPPASKPSGAWRLALLLVVLLFRSQILEACLVPVYQRPNALEQNGLTSGNKQSPMPRETRLLRPADNPGIQESRKDGRLPRHSRKRCCSTTGSVESSTNSLTSSSKGSSHHHVSEIGTEKRIVTCTRRTSDSHLHKSLQTR